MKVSDFKKEESISKNRTYKLSYKGAKI